MSAQQTTANGRTAINSRSLSPKRFADMDFRQRLLEVSTEAEFKKSELHLKKKLQLNEHSQFENLKRIRSIFVSLKLPRLNLRPLFSSSFPTGLLNHAQELAAEQSNPSRRLPSNEQELEFEVSTRISRALVINKYV